MLFNSIEFALFLPVVFVLYWFVFKKIKAQNILLLAASYIFYGWWDHRFLFLLFFSTFLDYYTGLRIANSTNKSVKKIWFWISISVNLGLLGFFKYYNFFVLSFADLLSSSGFHTNVWTLKILLPIGISFYTFHGMSYVIDIYKERIEPTSRFVDYAVFVSFFPLLVAGPIERATHLLPQIQKKRSFDYKMASDGLKQILWGLFKKMVIADNCAFYVNDIFDHYHSYTGSTLLIGAVLFAFQIYGDFSGYSDIALGVAKLFGIELLRNFAYPYFSRDIAEFWRRWHISLTTWFRDYLYIPLGGSKGTTFSKIKNTFIIFLVSGFWHGANWTFLIWGLLNAVFFIPLLLFNKNRNHLEIVSKNKLLPSLKDGLNIILTFFLVVTAWIFFRAENIQAALFYLIGILNKSLFTTPEKTSPILWASILFFMLAEWLQRNKQHALDFDDIPISRILRWTIYSVILIVTFSFEGGKQEFIYFQF